MITPPISPSYERRPAVYTGRVLCQIYFTGCLKTNVKREKLEKISIYNISKKQHYAGKNVVMNTKGYMHLFIAEKEKNGA